MQTAWDCGNLPRPFDQDRLRRGYERLNETLSSSETITAQDAETLAGFLAHDDMAAMLGCLFGNSPYLTRSVLKEPNVLLDAYLQGFDNCLDQILSPLAAPPPQQATTAETMALLRGVKRRAALLIAMAELARSWSAMEVVQAISWLADLSLNYALAQALRDSARWRKFTLPCPEDPLRHSGVFVIGMGKLGAQELNYSSDVDVILLYDQEKIDYLPADQAQQIFVRLTRDWVKIMEHLTGEGYVFRMDLRLRPDPGSTPLAISARAAETYYETLGQNWERAAMIKARIVAGDRPAGEAFLSHLVPFVWRKHLDFLALQDIHAIKRQINAQRGYHDIKLNGHNVKLGQGGIREIEFFVQTQQLIWGGRDAELRSPQTPQTLQDLAAKGHITFLTAADLQAAYSYLRIVEHRLQMIEDQQTQTLPEDSDGMAHIATFIGHDSEAEFRETLLQHLCCVQNHYAELFEDHNDPPELEGNLVFTGAEDDPGTLQTLANLGFERPAQISAAVRAWHHGRYRATRSRRAREILTELVPSLLKALGDTANPDMAFRSFDAFLSHLPGGVQLFSLFKTAPQLLALLAGIVGAAPRLAEHLGRNASVLDFVLCPEFFDSDWPLNVLAYELNEKLVEGQDVQDWLDLTRRWANDHKFRLGVLSLRGDLTPHVAGRGLSDVADTVMTGLFPRIEAEFQRKHGKVAGAGLVVLAMGKHGGQELSASSDLDLIFVYDVADGVKESDGDQPLTPGLYYTRLSQRLINALSAPTGEGILYKLDMRLRPSGADGPIACRLDTFEDYQNTKAWTWEHMALTRLRAVYGPDTLRKKTTAIARQVLTRARDLEKLRTDIKEMRERMIKTHPGKKAFDIKHRRGGLVDLEFIAQYLQLRHAHEHPEILSATTRYVFKSAGELGLLNAGEAGKLADACSFWLAIQGVERLTLENNADPADQSPDLQRLLAQAGLCEDFDTLTEKMTETAHFVSQCYDTLIASA